MRLRNLPRIPASEITDEAVYRDRRRLLGMLAASPLLGLSGCAEAEPPPPPPTRTTPAQARAGFSTSEEPTRYEDITTYNNFYEFGTNKDDPSRAAKTLRTSPWSVAVDGECAKPGTIGLEDLLKGMTPEERIYRLRCVEGWSMVIPWTGVPLAEVLKRFEPTSKAKYVAFTTLADPAHMPGVRIRSIAWPHREGLRIDDASHRVEPAAARGVRLLQQRQSRRRPSALEPGQRAPHRRHRQPPVRRPHPHAPVQRLRRPGGLALRRHGPQALVLTCRGSAF